VVKKAVEAGPLRGVHADGRLINSTLVIRIHNGLDVPLQAPPR
jgi:hypothetical protein